MVGASSPFEKHSWQANQIHVPQGNSAATAFLLDMKKKRKEKAAL